MASLNKVQLIGRLGSDPEVRNTQTGKAVVNVSLATQETKNAEVQWHRLSFWEKKAELIAQYCKKGSQIYVEGSIQYSEWTDKDGNKKPQTTINVWQMQFLDSKPQNGQQQSGYQNQPQHQVPPQVAAQFPDAQVTPGSQFDGIEQDGDIPF